MVTARINVTDPRYRADVTTRVKPASDGTPIATVAITQDGSEVSFTDIDENLEAFFLSIAARCRQLREESAA